MRIARFDFDPSFHAAAGFRPNATSDPVRLFVLHLRTFHNAEVAFRAGAECPKRHLVRLAFMSRSGDFIAVEFDQDGRLLQSGFVDLPLALGQSQKAAAEGLDRRHRQRPVGLNR
jgi:hypothetical protein